MMDAVSFDVSDFTELDLQTLETCSTRCEKVHALIQEWFILVNAQTQRLHLLQHQKPIRSYAISTALNGTGQEEGTGKTPLGWHQVQEKIGEGADLYAVFEARKATGEIATREKIAIVSRILRLAGLEEGYNRGKNERGVLVDSFDRYIYIHGTNDIEHLGRAFSEGCVRMSPEDVIDLFGKVPVETPVYIYTA